MSCREFYDKYGYSIKKDVLTKRAYAAWCNMKDRCLNKNSNSYANYGGRGIKIQKSWLEFINFYEDMGTAKKGMSIERIDVNGDYCKENCKWIPLRKQSDNRRCSVKLKYKGKTYTISQLCEKFNLDRVKANTRRKRGWTPEELVQDFRYKKIKFENKFFTREDLAKKLKISTCKLKGRIRLGWTEEDLKRGYKLRKFKYQGIVYSSRKELASKLKVPYTRFIVELKEGYSVDEILKRRIKNASNS